MVIARRFRPSRLSKRKALAYALSAVIFAAAMWLAMRLSFPPDSGRIARHHAAAQGPTVGVQANRDTVTIQQGDQARTYRFRKTDDGIVGEEVSPDQ